jgi:hypothetical protein
VLPVIELDRLQEAGLPEARNSTSPITEITTITSTEDLIALLIQST